MQGMPRLTAMLALGAAHQGDLIAAVYVYTYGLIAAIFPFDLITA